MDNRIKTTLFLGILTCLLVFVGRMIGGQQGMIFFFGLAVIMNMGAYWFSDKIVLRLYRAQPVPSGHPIHELVARLCRKATIPLPRVYSIPSSALNAFATGRNPSHAAVAVTEGLYRVLTEEELEGVLAHELSHVRNRDTLISCVAATVAGAIMMIANAAKWAAIFGGFGGRHHDDNQRGGGALELLFLAIVAPLAATLIQMAISRSREFLADSSGARLVGQPYGLAKALKKISEGGSALPANAATSHLFIVNPLSGRSLLSLFSTHPPVEERIRRLTGGRMI